MSARIEMLRVTPSISIGKLVTKAKKFSCSSHLSTQGDVAWKGKVECSAQVATFFVPCVPCTILHDHNVIIPPSLYLTTSASLTLACLQQQPKSISH
jgi:hypothetical protein